MTGSSSALRTLARLYGVQAAYRNMRWEIAEAGPESLVAALCCLGSQVTGEDDAAEAVAVRRRELWRRALEPVIVAWDGAGWFDVRLPAEIAEGSVSFSVELENGEERAWREDLSHQRPRRTAEIDGVRYVSKRLISTEALPLGYHRVTVEVTGVPHRALLICAPSRAYGFAPGPEGRTWGVFLPLYAIRSERNWGSGDFSDLESLMKWTLDLGGTVLGTLPLLAAYLDEPCDPAPYIPASRLFWNEFYVDVARAPEIERSSRARAMLEDEEVLREIAALRAGPRVEYRRLMALKRRVLEELAQSLYAEDSPRLHAHLRYVEEHPRLDDYARFRAAVERHRAAWDRWPERERGGDLRPGDYDELSARYHRYVQWIAEEQIGGLADSARGANAGLYLDLPLGVHRHGYDTWREREMFVLDASAGAPPDIMFTGGQDWGLAPLHPEANRLQGYRYTLAYLRQHMRHAGVLRIDHVMGLHRLFWIPKGLPASEGVYVRYPASEMAALLSLESHRNRCALVGENLGTVPWAVETLLQKHNLHRMYVFQYAVEPGPHSEPLAIAPDVVASANTHDMFPFEGFLRGLDIDDRFDLGLMSEQESRAERERREAIVNALTSFLRKAQLLGPEAEPGAVLRGVLAHMAKSAARVELVTLEDLWLETRPQNVPGTTFERPNWTQKARLSFEEFREDPFMLAVLREVDRLRRSGPP